MVRTPSGHLQSGSEATHNMNPAEGVRFELTVPFRGTPVFKTGSINRSDTPPPDSKICGFPASLLISMSSTQSLSAQLRSELTVPFRGTPVFKTGSINRSDTPPTFLLKLSHTSFINCNYAKTIHSSSFISFNKFTLLLCLRGVGELCHRRRAGGQPLCGRFPPGNAPRRGWPCLF